MIPDFYLLEFKKAAEQLERNLPAGKKLHMETGVWLDSVVVRLQKNGWANKPFEKPQSDAAVFFSIWLNEKTLKENRIYYNIHALKLRKLRGYKIASREFAAAFRAKFKPFESRWPNVSVDFGPLTLMEGWEKPDTENIQEDVFKIASRFLEIDSLIDEMLDLYKLKSKSTG